MFWNAVYETLWNVVSLIVAVFSCLCIVTIALYSTSTEAVDPRVPAPQIPYTPLPEVGVSETQRTYNSIGNAFLLLGVIIAMTCVMVSLFYYRFYAIIGTWIMMGSCLILLSSSIAFLENVFFMFNIPIDHITVGFVVWNFVAVGLIVVHHKGPKILQQAYLIVQSAFMALMLLAYIPPRTMWVILCIIPIWDLIAVLCVVGPLRILVETAKKRKQGLQPGLIFATMVFGNMIGMAVRRAYPTTSAEKRILPTARPASVRSPSFVPQEEQVEYEVLPRAVIAPGGKPLEVLFLEEEIPVEEQQPPQRREREAHSSGSEESEESEGIKMGLGDFVFYSVLVGKMALTGSFILTISCIVAVLVGMCVTLMLLAVVQAALPALPVSLGLGLLFAGFSKEIEAYHEYLTSHQVYI